MRILYVSHTHPPKGTILDNVGGMQRVSRQLIDELRRRNDVEVFTETVNVSSRGFIALQTTGFLLKSLIRLPKRVHRIDADIVLFSSMVTASLAWLLQNKMDVPMVTINHGRDVTLQVGIYQKLVPRIFAALDGVISVSKATRRESIQRGMNPEKGVVLPNGFELDMTQKLPAKAEARQSLQKRFSIPLDDALMLLTVGRKVKRKGHEWFIRDILPNIAHPVVYVTVGDGPEFENIEQSAEETRQKKDIFLLGRQPDAVLHEVYAAADLFVMPNVSIEGDMEGFGIVLLEANVAGTPAVASNLEGIKDVVTNGRNGYKIPADDAQKFADKINSLLAGDLQSFSDRARHHVQRKFGWSQVARRYVAYLREVVEAGESNHLKN